MQQQNKDISFTNNKKVNLLGERLYTQSSPFANPTKT